MLYDPKWKKPDPFTKESLIAFLETKPPEEEYNWGDCTGKCLFGQYLTSIGLDMESYVQCVHAFGYLLAVDHPRTFGGALDRARILAD